MSHTVIALYYSYQILYLTILVNEQLHSSIPYLL